MPDRTTDIERDVVSTQKPALKNLVRMWIYVVKNSKTIALLYLGLYVLLSLLRPLSAVLWGRYVDTLSGGAFHESLLGVILLLIGYYLINIATDILCRCLEGQEDIEQLNIVQENRFQERILSNVYRKLNRIQYEYWEIPQMNDIVNRNMQFMNDSWNGISRGVMQQSYAILAKAISVVSIAATLYIYSPWLCLILLVLPLPVFFTVFIDEKIRYKFIQDNTKLQRQANYYQDIMLGAGAKEIKTMGLYDFFYDKWKRQIEQYTKNEKKLYRNRTILNCGNSLISNLANIASCFLAILLMTAGKITVGALSAVLSLVSTLISDMGSLITGIAQFISKRNEATTFFQIMDLKEDPKERGEESDPTADPIQFNTVSYRYPMTDHTVLEDINISIRRGERVALVGENGAGKTTFVSLLTGLLEPSSGSVTFNGQASDGLNCESRFSATSCVVQMPSKYTTFTVGDNVYLGDTHRPRDEKMIEEALEFGGIGAGMKDELLGKDVGGRDLSGGQWQKLSISRACYRNRNIIVLDEPTSNLDPLAESEIFQKYMDLAGDKTVIFVTHRISVAALAQRIIVFDKGRIVGDGTHRQLMEENRVYARLYNEQSKWYDR